MTRDGQTPRGDGGLGSEAPREAQRERYGDAPHDAPGDAARGGIAVLRATDEDFRAVYETLLAAFGEAEDPKAMQIYREGFTAERAFVAVEEGQVVGSIGGDRLELTLPGGRGIGVGSIGWVGVLPTHTRRGALRRLMQAELDDIARRGEALAALHASEGGIYGRFGFAPATHFLGFHVDVRRARFREPAAGYADGGRVRLVPRSEAETLLPEVFDRARWLRAGQVERPPWLWRELFYELDRESRGAGLFTAIHEAHPGAGGASPDAYALYYIKEEWTGHVPRHRLVLEELVDAHPAGRAALWRFLLSLDLVATLTVQGAPADEPLAWMLQDPRVIGVDHLVDGMYLRMLDVPAALEARPYAGSGELVIRVRDAFRPQSGGTVLLQVRDGTGTCRPTDRTPHLDLETNALSAAYLGGVRLTTLAAAGMVRGEDRALHMADALFATPQAPWTATVF